MLNRQQRNFLKDMKEIEKEKKRQGEEEPLSYRRSRHGLRPRRIRNFAGASGVVITVVLIGWRIFAVSTWLHPLQLMISHRTIQSSVAVGPQSAFSGPSPLVSVGPENTQQSIHDYLQLSGSTYQALNAIVTPLLNANTVSSVSSQTFVEYESSLSSLMNSNRTNNSSLAPLEQFNEQQIRITLAILRQAQAYVHDRTISSWNKLDQLVRTYSSNWRSQTNIVASILSAAHMPYHINSNGSIRYTYIPQN